jgi:hypothetical protein
MPKKPLDYGSATKAEFLEMVNSGLSGMEISKVCGLSENQVQRRAQKLGVYTNGLSTMRERNLIEAAAYFVREEHSAFVSWSLASRNGVFVLSPKYMNAMQKFGMLRQEGKVWVGNFTHTGSLFTRTGSLVCGPRP